MSFPAKHRKAMGAALSGWILFLSLIMGPGACFPATDSLKTFQPLNEKEVTSFVKPSFFEATWVPITMSLISIDLMRDSAKYGLQRLIRQPFNGYETEIDDYIQYAPIVTMYTADLFKVPARNNAWNQTKFLALSEIGTSAIVQLLKYTLKIRRPNYGAYNAYPSGHASQAFVASQVLYNEYRYTNKAIALSGYLFSIPTGVLRIVNNRHWVPDVLLGAGIGILVTNLVYYFEPLKNWNPHLSGHKKRKTEMGFIPSINEDFVGGYFTLKF